MTIVCVIARAAVKANGGNQVIIKNATVGAMLGAAARSAFRTLPRLRAQQGDVMLVTPATKWRWNMADAGLFIGWGEVVRGRESEATELFAETLGYYARLQEEGVIESFEPVFLEPHGGDLTGFILLQGDAEKLASLRVSEEFIQLSIRVSLIVNNLGVVGADLGGRLQRQVEYYTEQIGAFA